MNSTMFQLLPIRCAFDPFARCADYEVTDSAMNSESCPSISRFTFLFTLFSDVKSSPDSPAPTRSASSPHRFCICHTAA